MLIIRNGLWGLLILVAFRASAQTSLPATFDTLRLSSRFTAFPDTARKNGHVYEGITYSANAHYRDSTVLVVIPRAVNKLNKISVVCWFHGWYNTVDSANQYFSLQQQFIRAAPNAIFIIPEMARNAPDSYGGKLEQEGAFALLVNDIFKQLAERNRIRLSARQGDIVLAGHSGAYRVMMHIAQQKTVPVRAIFLFDGLYRYADEFTKWLGEQVTHKWVHWYTHDGGGTDEESVAMMQLLQKENISFKNINEIEVTDEVLADNRCLFIASKRLHNDVIANPDNFYRCLKSLKWLY